MPLTPTSRYYGLPVYDAPDDAGQTHPTIAIRLNGEAGPSGATYQHVLTAGETIEYLAWRYYGSSASWWRIADANSLVFPLDAPPGATVVIPTGDDIGRITRTRRF